MYCNVQSTTVGCSAVDLNFKFSQFSDSTRLSARASTVLTVPLAVPRLRCHVHGTAGSRLGHMPPQLPPPYDALRALRRALRVRQRQYLQRDLPHPLHLSLTHIPRFQRSHPLRCARHDNVPRVNLHFLREVTDDLPNAPGHLVGACVLPCLAVDGARNASVIDVANDCRLAHNGANGSRTVEALRQIPVLSSVVIV